MSKIDLSIIDNKYKFIEFKENEVCFYFSTAQNGLNFSKNTEEGILNLKNLKKWFHLEDIGYLNQTHSDIVHVFDENIHDGDGIITNKKGVAVGVFTADCVPILIYDKGRGVIGAIHSGWKGTFEHILINGIKKMIEEYGTNIKDLSVYIGPHNMDCCYEVGEGLIEEFKNQEIYKNANISNGKNISLKNCIISQLKSLGIEDGQITSVDICTYCSNEFDLHSYRKQRESSGRMFSFIYMNK